MNRGNSWPPYSRVCHQPDKPHPTKSTSQDARDFKESEVHFSRVCKALSCFSNSISLFVVRERMQWSILVTIVQASLFITGAFAAFGLTESGNIYTVDTDGGLVFKSTSLHDQFMNFVELNRELLVVDKTTGDVTSMVFNGIEVGLTPFLYLSRDLMMLLGPRPKWEAQSNWLWNRRSLQLGQNWK